MENPPVLYSYRRCPYAMRARISLYLSGIQVEQREIVFWDKPEPMLSASPKGTVPVLILPDGQVIDESREIMFWAFQAMSQNMAQNRQACSNWLPTSAERLQQMNHWIDENDTEFKGWLDKYKYADRFPEQRPIAYRQAGEVFLEKLNTALASQNYLLGGTATMADIAVFPFIRQFVNVDKVWFTQANYPHLKTWLEGMLASEYFNAIMKNRPVWEPHHQALWVDEPTLKNRNQFLEKALATPVV